MIAKQNSSVHAKRIGPNLNPDLSRVLLRPFNPATEHIARRIVTRAMTLSDPDVAQLLENVLSEFEDRHEQVKQLLRRRFTQVQRFVNGNGPISQEREAL